MNRLTRFLFAFAFCAAPLLRAQLNAPNAGIVRYRDGTVHTVYGIPANYIVDRHVLASADAVSFSDSGGMIAKDGRILLVDAGFKTVGEYESGEAAPLLNMDGHLKSAIAWLPSAHALLFWDGPSFVVREVNGSGALGAVSSVRLAADHMAKLLATNPDGSVCEASISLVSGEVTSVQILPGLRGPAFRQRSFLIFSDVSRDVHSLALATSSAILQTFPLPDGRLTFERMSSDAVHISSRDTDQNWILHLGASGPSHLSQLPEPQLSQAQLPQAQLPQAQLPQAQLAPSRPHAPIVAEGK